VGLDVTRATLTQAVVGRSGTQPQTQPQTLKVSDLLDASELHGVLPPPLLFLHVSLCLSLSRGDGGGSHLLDASELHGVNVNDVLLHLSLSSFPSLSSGGSGSTRV